MAFVHEHFSKTFKVIKTEKEVTFFSKYEM